MSKCTKPSLLVAALCFGAGLSLPAYAQEGEAPPEPKNRFIEFLDADGNGTVEFSEISEEHHRLFAASDVDGDGRLSPDEFRRRGELFQRLHTSTLFDLLDANGDAMVSPDEIDAPSSRWFKRYDLNADNVLDAEEVPARRKHRR
ncbi:MAG TPA: hypothetical protein VED46_06130 [Alphaproteobacteria bacterium]|nr:hypothetical protein [Alphaproteobacteria bacterium]